MFICLILGGYKTSSGGFYEIFRAKMRASTCVQPVDNLWMVIFPLSKFAVYYMLQAVDNGYNFLHRKILLNPDE